MLLVGDIILDEPEPDRLFDGSRETLAHAGVVAGHVEVPHTERGLESSLDIPAPGSDPKNLLALGRAGFHVATLAGNHIFDAGPDGIADTVEGLRAQGIQTTGAAMNLNDARKPAIVERDGIRCGFFSYNCVGTKNPGLRSPKPAAPTSRSSVITNWISPCPAVLPPFIRLPIPSRWMDAGRHRGT